MWLWTPPTHFLHHQLDLIYEWTLTRIQCKKVIWRRSHFGKQRVSHFTTLKVFLVDVNWIIEAEVNWKTLSRYRIAYLENCKETLRLQYENSWWTVRKSSLNLFSQLNGKENSIKFKFMPPNFTFDFLWRLKKFFLNFLNKKGLKSSITRFKRNSRKNESN